MGRSLCPYGGFVSRGVSRSLAPIASPLEVSEHLVGSPAFKAGGTGDPRPAGSIPVHLRHPGF